MEGRGHAYRRGAYVCTGMYSGDAHTGSTTGAAGQGSERHAPGHRSPAIHRVRLIQYVYISLAQNFSSLSIVSCQRERPQDSGASQVTHIRCVNRVRTVSAVLDTASMFLCITYHSKKNRRLCEIASAISDSVCTEV